MSRFGKLFGAAACGRQQLAVRRLRRIGDHLQIGQQTGLADEAEVQRRQDGHGGRARGGVAADLRLFGIDPHVVCVVDPATGFGGIYTNGVLEKAVTNSWPALGSVSTAWSFLGRSLWSADAWLNGTIDEFRIYDGRMTPEEIAADNAAGPDTLYQKVPLTMTKTSGGYTFNWPSYAPGFTLQSSTVLGSDEAWNPVSGTPVISNGWYGLTVSATGTNAFFRLSR